MSRDTRYTLASCAMFLLLFGVIIVFNTLFMAKTMWVGLSFLPAFATYLIVERIYFGDLQKGVRFLQEQKARDALPYLENALQKFQENLWLSRIPPLRWLSGCDDLPALAALHLATAHFLLNAQDEAERFCGYAIERDQELGLAYQKLGAIQVCREELLSARKSLLKAQELGTGITKSTFQRGFCSPTERDRDDNLAFGSLGFSLGFHEEALERIGRAKDPASVSIRLGSLVALGRCSEADALAERSLRRHSASPRAWWNGMKTHLAQGRFEEALALSETAEEEVLDDETLRVTVLESKLNLASESQLDELLEQTKSLEIPYQDAVRLEAIALRQLGRIDEAYSLLSKAECKLDLLSRLFLAQQDIEGENFESGVPALRRVITELEELRPPLFQRQEILDSAKRLLEQTLSA